MRNFDAKWAEEFAIEATALHLVFGDVALLIEHVGSTAVPGLAGKPVIDILVLVHDVAAVDDFNQKMEQVGYRAMGEYVKPGSRLFVKEKGNVRLCNVHIFSEDHPHVREMIDLRDYLRTHPDEAKRYSQLKQSLYEKNPEDYGAYRKGKDEYVTELLHRMTTQRYKDTGAHDQYFSNSS